MKKIITLTSLMAGLFFVAFSLSASTPGNPPPTKKIYSDDCAVSTAQIDLSVNKVRARLQIGGDLWWDGNQGQYLVPHPSSSGQPLVSSLSAGALWMGGRDPAGNLKVAVQTQGRAMNRSDYYPGPLTEPHGTTDAATCNNWDKFFKVRKTDIEEHLRLYDQAVKGEIVYTEDMIPAAVKGWPAQGNPYFEEMHGFALPISAGGLADFYDENENGTYEPLEGDFPSAGVGRCYGDSFYYEEYWDYRASHFFPDEFVFWIFNDNGNAHRESQGGPMQLEVQAMAFAYKTPGMLDYSTFYKYKIINRAVEDIRDAYFGLWLKPGIGCPDDDFMGIDTTRNLVYLYNGDAEDVGADCVCSDGSPGFCDRIPALGIDLLKGMRGDVPYTDYITGEVKIDSLTGDTIFIKMEQGIKSFTYYNEGGLGSAATGRPENDQEFYNYLTGRWKDGSPVTNRGTGYNTGEPTRYAFPAAPDCKAPDCWSMCSEGFPEADRAFVMSSGKFKLRPGQLGEMVFGVMWIPEVEYPCPDLSILFEKDDDIQALFDNCRLESLIRPDPPYITWNSGNQTLTGLLSNEDEHSSNYHETYAVPDYFAPEFLTREEKIYKFEGYQLFQVLDEEYWRIDLSDPAKARLVFQTDIPNGIGECYEWTAEPNPDSTGPPIWTAEAKVFSANADQGPLQHSFQLEYDAFTPGERLQNDKEYFYLVRAYATNRWKAFDPLAGGGLGSGQRREFYSGYLNIYKIKPQDVSKQNEPELQPDLLNDILVVPNPYCCLSANGKGSGGSVRVINLPDESTVTVFDVHGRLVKRWQPGDVFLNTLEWNLQNESGTAVGTGIYFFRIDVPGVGSKVLKWVGMSR